MLKKYPLDENGDTLPHDHKDILDGDWIIRGISALWIKDGRISSGAFKSSSDPYCGMSVDLEKLDPDTCYPNDNHEGAVKMLSSVPRSKDLKVGYEPVTGNSAHCQVWRYENEPAKITSSAAKTMSRNVEWHVEIEGVDIPQKPDLTK